MSAMPARLTEDDRIFEAIPHRRVLVRELCIASRVGQDAQRHQTHRTAR